MAEWRAWDACPATTGRGPCDCQPAMEHPRALSGQECEAQHRLHDFSDSSMAYLTCDIDSGQAHGGLNHHDPVHGIWWNACTLPEHGHGAPGKNADLL